DWVATTSWEREEPKRPTSCDATDDAGVRTTAAGKPEVSVGAGRQTRCAASARERKHRDRSGRSDPANLSNCRFNEPDVVIGTDCDCARTDLLFDAARQLELGDRS